MTLFRIILRILFRGCITKPHDPVAEWRTIAHPATLTTEQINEFNRAGWRD